METQLIGDNRVGTVQFGGIKRSGYGRELTHHGIREFTDIKTVWVD